jgi:hypothetical protein
MDISDMFSDIKFVKKIPKKEIICTYNDIFPYYRGKPCDNISDYETFIGKLFKYKETFDFDDEFSKEDEDDMHEGNKQLANSLEKPVYNNITTIYAEITYPLTNKAIVKFVKKPYVILTNGRILYAYTYAYQLVYEEDGANNQECIPGMFNIQQSKGKFGIWGHAICDLLYNGTSTIEVGKTHIKCNFQCDS